MHKQAKVVLLKTIRKKMVMAKIVMKKMLMAKTAPPRIWTILPKKLLIIRIKRAS